MDFVAGVNRQRVYSNYGSSALFPLLECLYDPLLKPFKKPLVIAKASPEQKHDALLVERISEPCLARRILNKGGRGRGAQ